MRVALAMLATGCFSKPGFPADLGDASQGAADGSGSGSAPCSAYSPWLPSSTMIAGLNTGAAESDPAMTPDGLEIAFVRDSKIMLSVRNATTEAWNPPVEAANVNTTVTLASPWLSPSHLVLTYGCDGNLCQSVRPNTEIVFLINNTTYVAMASEPSLDSQNAFVFYTHSNVNLGSDIAAQAIGSGTLTNIVFGDTDVLANPSIGNHDSELVWTANGEPYIATVAVAEGVVSVGTATPIDDGGTAMHGPYLSSDGLLLLYDIGGEIGELDRTCITR